MLLVNTQAAWMQPESEGSVMKKNKVPGNVPKKSPEQWVKINDRRSQKLGLRSHKAQP